MDVSGKPQYGDNVTSHAEATVNAIEAKISVEKTLTVPANGKGTAGTPLTYSIVVTNDGQIDLEHVFVLDQFDVGLIPTPSADWSMNGQFMNQSDIGPLIVGQSKTLTLYGQVTSTTTETLYNTVTVDAKPKNSGTNVTDTDDAPIDIKAPSILVEKTLMHPADGEGTYDTVLTYSIDVTNNGNINLAHVFVWDLFDAGLEPIPMYGWRINGQFTNQSDIGPLTVGQRKTLTLYGLIKSKSTETLYNTVTVDARPENGGQNVTDSDDAPVSVKEPGISVIKTLTSPAGGMGANGTPLVYSIEVENTGTIDLEHVFVEDVFDIGLIPKDSAGWIMDGQNMYISDIGPLSSGESKLLPTLNGKIVANEDKKLLNNVTVHGKPKNSITNVTATDDAPVEIKFARINVAKTAYPPEGVPETVINNTIVITNNGTSYLFPHAIHPDPQYRTRRVRLLGSTGLELPDDPPQEHHVGANDAAPFVTGDAFTRSVGVWGAKGNREKNDQRRKKQNPDGTAHAASGQPDRSLPRCITGTATRSALPVSLHDLAPGGLVELFRLFDQHVGDAVFDLVAAAGGLVGGDQRLAVQHERRVGEGADEDVEKFLADRHRRSFHCFPRARPEGLTPESLPHAGPPRTATPPRAKARA